MPMDLFEKLADVPVPPPPPSQAFDRTLHKRINDRLFVGQLFDFVFRGCGYAALHFARASWAVLRLTFTGKLDGKSARKGPEV